MIGIFDSGSGGLTVLQALRTRAPQADVVYFGDIENAPYGSRSAADLIQLTTDGIQSLMHFGASEIIVACNSVSASVLSGVASHSRIVDMTRPTARAMRRHAGKRVLLIATQATIASKLYSDALDVIVLLDPLPISGLASSIEFGASAPEIADIVRRALEERKGKKYDQILLGCTHYPLARSIIEEEAKKLFGDVEYFDPAGAVAIEAAQRFNIHGKGNMMFKISKDSEHFRRRVEEMFSGELYSIEIT